VFFLRSARGVVLDPASEEDSNGESGTGDDIGDKAESTTSNSEGGRRRR
jgi:hypothetical protein